MANKTDRILSHLPATFRALPKPTALYAVADAFGNELLVAENSLAEIAAAHWVDQADRNSEFIIDLARIAALYGLAPRDDEEVEEFRAHLKRYVRLFLDGTATVSGVLRVAAEALGLRLTDDVDGWWEHRSPVTIDSIALSDDAARRVFGMANSMVAGTDATAARLEGTADLSQGLRLGTETHLRLAVDGGPAHDIDLAASATLDAAITAINATVGAPLASRVGGALALTSPTQGVTSALTLPLGANDSAPALLGLAPHGYHGRAASAAQLTGVAFAGLAGARYLRLRVDGGPPIEVDLDGAATAADVQARINAAASSPIATVDAARLRLTSPTTGFNSQLALLPAPAQDARSALFGTGPTSSSGAAAQAATVAGTPDLSAGVDLSSQASLQVRLDGGPVTVIDCRGADPAHTTPAEIVAALNDELGAGVASHDGRFIRLTSPTAGTTSQIAFEPLPVSDDGSGLILGLPTRQITGRAATAARLTGTVDLSAGVNLWALHRVRLAVDDRPEIDIDLRAGLPIDRIGAATLADLVTALNAALGPGRASHDGRHLLLTSPTQGSASRVVLTARSAMRRRQYVTAAFVADEAAEPLLGFVRGEAVGAGPRPAQIVGQADLSRGVDLRATPSLRVSVDGGAPVDLDCTAGVPRPRVALPGEVVAAINARLPGLASLKEGQYLVFTSPTAGADSRIVFAAPGNTDAAPVLGLAPGLARGVDATSVTFNGLVDLSAGVSLPAGVALKLAVDAAAAVEVVLNTDAAPALKMPIDLALAINTGLGKQVARTDGSRLWLTSTARGAVSLIGFEAPAGPDATPLVFGVPAGRAYRGADAQPASVTGSADLSGGADLRQARYLTVVFDGQPVTLDAAQGVPDPAHASLDQIRDALNAGLAAEMQARHAAANGTGSPPPSPIQASHDGRHLTLATTVTGSASQLELRATLAGDARGVLFGPVPDETRGQAAMPATLTGTIDVVAPVDLSHRRMLRLTIDGAEPIDLDVASARPQATFLNEAVERLNAAVPGLASAANDRLQLTSPTAGESSRIAVVPRRVFELIEYPPQPRQATRDVQVGERWWLEHDGAAEAELTVTITAPHGLVDPLLLNVGNGQWVRIHVIMTPGAALTVWRDPEHGWRATLREAGTERAITAITTSALDTLALRLPLGRSAWRVLACVSARFDDAWFNADRFAGGRCATLGVFDLSRFSTTSAASVFAPVPLAGPRLTVDLAWERLTPGAFIVNLPGELPERYGARFNEGRFGQPGGQPETIASVVTEPASDPDHLLTRVNAESKLVQVALAPRVPIGFEAVALPTRQPRLRRLRGGNAVEPARLYLIDPDVPGQVLVISAAEPGEWGNALAVGVRKVAPARFDVTVHYAGAVFECARQIAYAGRLLTGGEVALPVSLDALAQPGPVGVIHAKAAGVHATVTRPAR